MRRALVILAMLVGAFGALYFWRYEIGWRFTFLLNPGGHFDEAEAGPALDYSEADAWILRADGDSIDSAAFYIHPTTLLRTKTWNQPVADARADAFLDFIAPQQYSVFEGLPVFAPYYRQAAFYAFIPDGGDSKSARDLATTDVVDAFKTFMASYPAGPIIIVGHSQGAYHALALLHALEDDTTTMARIAVVYAIGYPVPVRYLSSAAPMPACTDAQQVHCVVSYNARGRDAYIPGFFEKTPLPEGAPRGEGPLACWNFSNDESVVNGDCDDDGWLVIDRPPERYREFLMSREWYHSVEIDLFADELRDDAAARLNALQSQ